MNALLTASGPTLALALALSGGAYAQTPPAQPPQDRGTAAPSRSEDARIQSEIMRQLYDCWHPPPGASATATVRFALNRNGTLAGSPTLVRINAGVRSQGVIDSAMRAVRECTLHLPPARYDLWRDIEADFDAQQK